MQRVHARVGQGIGAHDCRLLPCTPVRSCSACSCSPAPRAEQLRISGPAPRVDIRRGRHGVEFATRRAGRGHPIDSGWGGRDDRRGNGEWKGELHSMETHAGRLPCARRGECTRTARDLCRDHTSDSLRLISSLRLPLPCVLIPCLRRSACLLSRLVPSVCPCSKACMSTSGATQM